MPTSAVGNQSASPLAPSAVGDGISFAFSDLLADDPIALALGVTENKSNYRAQVGAFDLRGLAVASTLLFRDRHLILDAIPNTSHLLATGQVVGYTSAMSSSPSKPEPAMSQVTRILSTIEQGDPHAAEQLLPLVYDELRKLAAQKLAQEKPGQTLQATALVHEAYLRLVEVDQAQHWNSRGHFFGAAAEAMRRILVENARRKQSRKRGGDRVRLDLEQLAVATSDRHDEVLDIDAALAGLARADPQAAELVKLRYFAGLSIPQAAEVLGVSSRSADFLWAYARAWLLRSLGGTDSTA
jgi:RNA polymerase sigma factor (TIGR02999 family)